MTPHASTSPYLQLGKWSAWGIFSLSAVYVVDAFVFPVACLLLARLFALTATLETQS